MPLPLLAATSGAAATAGAAGVGSVASAGGLAGLGGVFNSPFAQGLMNLGGSLWSSSRNQASAREYMNFQANQAQINRNWLSEMSNTEVQRRMADLKAAGINPVLAGSMAGSTPGAPMPGGTSASFENPAASATAGMRAKKEMEMVDAQIKLLENQAKKTKAEAEVVEHRVPVSHDHVCPMTPYF